jgi:SWI/SNF-related matrix-associated actin-dependent regulator of chromatin subfamily A-like protein 1
MSEPAAFPFQIALEDAMVNARPMGRANPTLFVAADMGLGKSRCAIKAAGRRRAKRVFVNCPTIGLVSWPAELEKWAPRSRWMVVTDPAMVPGADDLPPSDEPLYVFSPYSEIARRPAAWVEAATRFGADIVILDEAHFLSHMSSARTQAIYGWRADLNRSMVRPDQVVWPLSGTPAPNFTSELWPHLHALAPDTIRHPIHGRPMSEQEFLERFATVRTSAHGQHVTGSTNTPLLRQMTAEFFHRIRKSEVRSEMPPIVWTTEPLPISAATAQHYLDFPEGLDDAGLLDWLRTAYPSGSSERKATGLAKVAGAIEWCRNFLAGSDRKLILFAWHRDVLAPIHAALGPEFGSVCIDGDTPHRVRIAAVTEFQNEHGGPRLFCGQMLAAGTAITLTAASDVAFIEDDWTPGTMEQAAARADRLGQTRGVVARILYTPGTKDEVIAKARVRKAREFNLMFN